MSPKRHTKEEHERHQHHHDPGQARFQPQPPRRHHGRGSNAGPWETSSNLEKPTQNIPLLRPIQGWLRAIWIVSRPPETGRRAFTSKDRLVSKTDQARPPTRPVLTSQEKTPSRKPAQLPTAQHKCAGKRRAADATSECLPKSNPSIKRTMAAPREPLIQMEINDQPHPAPETRTRRVEFQYRERRYATEIGRSISISPA